MKYELKTSEHGDQYFIMLDSKIVQIFINYKQACSALTSMNKLSKITITKKEGNHVKR